MKPDVNPRSRFARAALPVGLVLFAVAGGAAVGSIARADDNHATIRQHVDGAVSVATVEQIGDANRAEIVQGIPVGLEEVGIALEPGLEDAPATAAAASGPQSGNVASIIQNGAGNEAIAVQYGAGNRSTTVQTGRNNTATSVLIGNGNGSDIDQRGDNNAAEVVLMGDGNALVAEQDGQDGFALHHRGDGSRWHVGGSLIQRLE